MPSDPKGSLAALDRQEALDTPLERHAFLDDVLGMCIKHPLVFSIMHNPKLNALINDQYRHKSQEADLARSERHWWRFIALHERPYRLTALLDVEHEMKDAEYWEAVAEIWTDSENIFELESLWFEVLAAPRTDRHHMMEEEDRHTLAAMTDPITIFRGFNHADRELGLSWTINREKAEWFAQRFVRKPDGTLPQIVTATVPRDAVIAYLSARGEEEIVVFPENVEIQKVEAC